MTQILKRDPSTGRFIKPTPSEKVAAHAERINTAHPGTGIYWTAEQAEAMRANAKKLDFPNTAQQRSQPIEYDKPPMSNRTVWLILAAMVALVALVVLMGILLH
jgi:hypothetical protein